MSYQCKPGSYVNQKWFSVYCHWSLETVLIAFHSGAPTLHCGTRFFQVWSWTTYLRITGNACLKHKALMKGLSRDPKSLSFKHHCPHSPISPSTLAWISNLSFFHFQNWSILQSTSILISQTFELVKGYLDSDADGGREELRTGHLQVRVSGEKMPREQDSGPSRFLQPTITGQTFKTTFKRPCFQTVMYFSTSFFNRWPFQQSEP